MMLPCTIQILMLSSLWLILTLIFPIGKLGLALMYLSANLLLRLDNPGQAAFIKFLLNNETLMCEASGNEDIQHGHSKMAMSGGEVE